MDSGENIDVENDSPQPLSIPLNGFCTITAYVVCGNFSISIHMDSIQLSPRKGAS